VLPEKEGKHKWKGRRRRRRRKIRVEGKNIVNPFLKLLKNHKV
jgi:hypothetical protein